MAKRENHHGTGIQPTSTTRNNGKETCDGFGTRKENEKPNPQQFMQELASETLSRLGPVPSGYIIDKRYEVLRRIGCGEFGNVYRVKVVGTEDTKYAMKIIKSKHSITPSILREINILSHIASIDPENKSCIVRLIESFSFHEHVCIVYELLGPTLMNVLVKNKREGFSMKQVREITYQLVTAVKFLHQNGMIHHDIKPSNVSFLYREFETDKAGRKVTHRADVKLIDFGSTVYIDQQGISSATTKQYRSPEVGLRYTLSEACDIWSIGCTVFEIYTGRLLFPCVDEVEKCHMIEAILEQRVPSKMGKTSRLACFNELGMLECPNPGLRNQIQKRIKPLNEYQINPKDEDTKILFDLLRKMLQIDPNNRIRAEDILKHPFFVGMGSTSE